MIEPLIPPILIAPGVSDKRNRDFIAAFSTALEEFKPSALVVQDAWTAPAELLPIMVVEASLTDFVSPDLREDLLRALIDAAPDIHALSGLVAGTRRALSAMGIEVDWQQWWQQEPKGHHNTHVVTAWMEDGILSGHPLLSLASRRAIGKVVEATKRKSQDIDFRIGFRAGFEEVVDLDETAAVAIVHDPIDVWPDGLRYDGRTSYDHAAYVRYDGQHDYDGLAHHSGPRRRSAVEAEGRVMRLPYCGVARYDGTFTHNGLQPDRWQGDGALHDNERFRFAAELTHAAEDRLGIVLFYDGTAHHDAAYNHGGEQPVIADAEMTIIVNRHIRYDGSYRHAGHRYDGTLQHDGSSTYYTGIFYAGVVPQVLVA